MYESISSANRIFPQWDLIFNDNEKVHLVNDSASTLSRLASQRPQLYYNRFLGRTRWTEGKADFENKKGLW